MSRLHQLKDSVQSLPEELRRNLLILVAVMLTVALAYGSVSQHVAALERKKNGREQVLTELMQLRQRYLTSSADSARLANRMAAVTPTDTPASILEQTGLIPKGGLEMKPLPIKGEGDIREDGAVLTISGIQLNETVNLLYQVEQGGKPLIIRKGVLRGRFNDPSRLDITLTTTLLRPNVAAEVEQ